MTTSRPPEDNYLPISFLNDFLFCERRAALHLLEGIWKDNQYTVEGAFAHRNVDVEGSRKRGDKRNVTGMWVVSHRMGLIGRCDRVEFVSSDSPEGVLVPYPVDFKRGKKRRWDNDEVQLCAQAMCLEEMLEVQVAKGAIFHIKSQHRQEVNFDLELRSKTEDAAVRLAELLAQGQTPLAKYHAKCRGCSLFEWCMPKSLRPRATAKRYLQSLIDE
ncbi:MAG: CRISPR-associated protein Cas4 [Planctomycetaceae bacterium]|nr:CRISPR-associated protein Cas4 [Planctomycetaceae bacterium]